MTSITWVGPRCVQEAAAILGPQNRTQGRCVVLLYCTNDVTGEEIMFKCLFIIVSDSEV